MLLCLFNSIIIISLSRDFLFTILDW